MLSLYLGTAFFIFIIPKQYGRNSGLQFQTFFSVTVVCLLHQYGYNAEILGVLVFDTCVYDVYVHYLPTNTQSIIEAKLQVSFY